MEADKEQLVSNIIANFDYIKHLLCEDNLGETEISALFEPSRLLEDTNKRLMEMMRR